MERREFFGFSRNVAALAALSAVGKSEAEASKPSFGLSSDRKKVFKSVQKKLNCVRRYVGYGNFNIIDFDGALKMAGRSPKVDRFSKKELDFIEELFYEDANRYGFYGRKTCKNLTDTINKKEVVKIPHTGHYLFRGKPEIIYEQLKKDIGDSIILTSGVRSIVKQMSLYFNKIDRCNGNIALASHSIAPPCYSYHSIGDFDVGKKGWGYANFTARFARTEEFWKLMRLHYVCMRYNINNKDGVRFEPWHVKIV